MKFFKNSSLAFPLVVSVRSVVHVVRVVLETAQCLQSSDINNVKTTGSTLIARNIFIYLPISQFNFKTSQRNVKSGTTQTNP